MSNNRIDLTRDPALKCGTTRTLVHIRGFYGDGGENEGVMSISAQLDESPNYPDSGRIIVGSPSASPLIESYIPDLGGFSCGAEAAEMFAAELLAAAAAVRAAIKAGR